MKRIIMGHREDIAKEDCNYEVEFLLYPFIIYAIILNQFGFDKKTNCADP